MVEFRRINSTDVAGVTALAMRALEPSLEYALHLDRAKVEAMVWSFVGSSGHFGMAAFENGKPVGAIALYVLPSPFFERHEGHVVMCFAEKPGTGLHLMRSMMDWVRRDVRVRRVVWSMNEDKGADSVAQRFGRLVQRRFGFTARHDNLVFYKG